MFSTGARTDQFGTAALWAYPADSWSRRAEVEHRREQLRADWTSSRRPSARLDRPARPRRHLSGAALRLLHLRHAA